MWILFFSFSIWCKLQRYIILPSQRSTKLLTRIAQNKEMKQKIVFKKERYDFGWMHMITLIFLLWLNRLTIGQLKMGWFHPFECFDWGKKTVWYCISSGLFSNRKTNRLWMNARPWVRISEIRSDKISSLYGHIILEHYRSIK